MNNSAALSQFAVNLKYEDIPAEVIEMAKKWLFRPSAPL